MTTLKNDGRMPPGKGPTRRTTQDHVPTSPHLDPWFFTLRSCVVGVSGQCLGGGGRLSGGGVGVLLRSRTVDTYPQSNVRTGVRDEGGHARLVSQERPGGIPSLTKDFTPRREYSDNSGFRSTGGTPLGLGGPQRPSHDGNKDGPWVIYSRNG